MTDGRPSVSVVVPVYNGASTLPELVRRLEPVLAEQSSEFEVILVDDGSKDASWTTTVELARKFRFVHGIGLMRNYGQHNALLCGVRAARYEVVVTMDDDLQNPPEEVPKLLAELERGFDVVYGTPEKEQHGLLRDVASRVTKLALSSVLGAKVAPKVSAFRAFRVDARAAFSAYQSAFVSLDVLLSWATVRFGAVAVRHEPRQSGESQYTFRALVLHALNMMTGFSVRPLQFASLMGFGLTLFGIAVLAYVVGRFLVEGGAVPGFPFLASIIAIFSGAQLFALGIIGEYLARMHFRTMGRPSYVVGRHAGTDDERSPHANSLAVRDAARSPVPPEAD